MNKKIAVFPGSFDPITLGHYDIIIRALNLFDKIVIAIGKNFEKKNMFSLKKRKKWIQKTFLSLSHKIEIDSFNGLTISFCIKRKAKFLLRGVRNQLDFEFEKNIFLINKELYKKHIIETVYLFSSYDKSHISSYIVRDVIKNGGDYTTFVPSSVRI
ncbi:pantetheine-phosphate adenylyltransferase [Blattabacterium cuenoti]|uniref:Phosphopantetheine adenylyltransferase n=2 Tax=Blattabacterium cuenoti TaxID=1653831 RepID=M4ZTI6_9FLAO|nr:pantetheine-phosphate adenylyltransferase [Blattabacterium cuenoti]BAM99638.1 pantetheine-phosphate adenylyltransferase [Blattabacterium cuenoti BPAA]BAR92095.1 pantetheine-phosphate adenylyltransferase [Blattabacterium cuenoti BPAY]